MESLYTMMDAFDGYGVDRSRYIENNYRAFRRYRRLSLELFDPTIRRHKKNDQVFSQINGNL